MQQGNTSEAKIKDLLIQLKDEFGLSQLLIAERCSLSDQLISDIMTGKSEAGKHASAVIRLLFELENLKRMLDLASKAELLRAEFQNRLFQYGKSEQDRAKPERPRKGKKADAGINPTGNGGSGGDFDKAQAADMAGDAPE